MPYFEDYRYRAQRKAESDRRIVSPDKKFALYPLFDEGVSYAEVADEERADPHLARSHRPSRRIDEEALFFVYPGWNDEEPAERPESCDEIEFYVQVPLKFEVCPTCRGRGTHVNPSIDDNGLSAEDFREDPDFEESYFRGDYNVTCYECGGANVVPVPDLGRCSPSIKTFLEEDAQAEAAREREDRADRMTQWYESGCPQ